MKRLLLLISALSFVAAAQVPVMGLPQFGVETEGTSTFLSIINTSQKTILGAVLRGEGADVPSTHVIWRLIPADGNAYLSWTAQTDKLLEQTRAYLDDVIFTDGSVVGPDNSGSLPGLALNIAAWRNTGKLLSVADDKTAAFAKLQAIQELPFVSTGNRLSDVGMAAPFAARLLLHVQSTNGDDAAITLANELAVMTVPTVPTKKP